VPPAVAEKVAAGTLAPEDAAVVAGVARSTVYEAKRRAAKTTATPAKGKPGRPRSAAGAGVVKLGAQPPNPATAPPAAPPAPPDSEPEGDVDLDPLATLARAQRGLERDLANLSPELVASRRAIGTVLVQVAKATEAIRRMRPAEPTPNEIHEKVRAAMSTSADFLLRHTREAAAKLAKDRKDFEVWCTATLAPAHAAEVVSKVDRMLGGSPG
jgi:hypothetical protein